MQGNSSPSCELVREPLLWRMVRWNSARRTLCDGSGARQWQWQRGCGGRATAAAGTKERGQRRAASLRKRADVCIWPWVGKSRSRRDERQGRNVLADSGWPCHLHALQAQHCHRTPRQSRNMVYPLQHCKPVCSRTLEPHAASTQTPCRLYAGQRLPAAARQQSAPSLLNLHGQQKSTTPPPSR
jgi:hypothetical protein